MFRIFRRFHPQTFENRGIRGGVGRTSVAARDRRRIKAATDKFPRRGGKKRGVGSVPGLRGRIGGARYAPLD